MATGSLLYVLQDELKAIDERLGQHASLLAHREIIVRTIADLKDNGALSAAPDTRRRVYNSSVTNEIIEAVNSAAAAGVTVREINKALDARGVTRGVATAGQVIIRLKRDGRVRHDRATQRYFPTGNAPVIRAVA